MKFRLILISLAVISLSVSCRKGCTDELALNYEENAKKDDGSCEYAPTTVAIDVLPKFNDQILELNKDYINITGDRLQFTDIKLIITNVKMNNQIITDAAYFDYKDGTRMITSEMDIEPGTYSGLEFFIGVDEARNTADPAQYAPEHPLSINTAGNMHWSWNTGYIFFKIEGRYDLGNTGTGTPDDLFVYHLGMNQYRKLWSDANFSLEVTEYETSPIGLELDLAKVFYSNTDTIYLSNGEDFTHTGPNQEALNIKLSNHFPNAIKAVQ